jgi:transposase
MKKAKNILKISYGIDISSDDFAASYGVFYSDMEREVTNIKKFKNTKRGFDKFISFTKKHQSKINPDGTIQTWYVMEASGVYYENLAYYLNEKGLNVHVALANKVKSYIKTLENKSKNDELDSIAIAQYGLEKQLLKWTPPSPEMKGLKELSRELSALKDMRTAAKNQSHAKDKAHEINNSSIKRIKELIKYLNKQIKKVEKELVTAVKENPELEKFIDDVTILKGVGFQTVVLVIAETNGFEGIQNRRQITSYVGLDVKENQSGKKAGKSSISKHGNKYIRKGLYMPALSCKKHDKKMKDLYERICERHGYKNKKTAIVAVMRKILHIIYALWKNKTKYDPNYRIA